MNIYLRKKNHTGWTNAIIRTSPSLERYMPLAISLQHQQFSSAFVQEAIDTSTVVFQFSFSKKLLHF